MRLAPPFWLSETPGEVSRQLNAIVDLDIIDDALSAVASNVRKTQTMADVCKDRLHVAQEKKQELRRIYDSVVGGADYVTERDAALFNTIDELDAFMLKKTANLLRTVNNSTIEADTHKIVAHEFVFQMGFLRISNLMGISIVAAPIFRMKVNSLKNSVKGYNPSIPTYPEVEE